MQTRKRTSLFLIFTSPQDHTFKLHLGPLMLCQPEDLVLNKPCSSFKLITRLHAHWSWLGYKEASQFGKDQKGKKNQSHLGIPEGFFTNWEGLLNKCGLKQKSSSLQERKTQCHSWEKTLVTSMCASSCSPRSAVASMGSKQSNQAASHYCT